MLAMFNCDIDQIKREELNAQRSTQIGTTVSSTIDPAMPCVVYLSENYLSSTRAFNYSSLNSFDSNYQTSSSYVFLLLHRLFEKL